MWWTYIADSYSPRDGSNGELVRVKRRYAQAPLYLFVLETICFILELRTGDDEAHCFCRLWLGLEPIILLEFLRVEPEMWIGNLNRKIVTMT